jgi:hypothetical protein
VRVPARLLPQVPTTAFGGMPAKISARITVRIFFLLTFFLLCGSGFRGVVADDAFAWRFSTGGTISARPVRSPDGTLYVVSEDRYLYALTGRGTLKWRSYIGARVWNGLSVSPDGTVYVTLKTEGLVAVNSVGRIVWRFATEGTPVGSPAVRENGMIYCGTDSGVIYCIAHTGRPLWSRELPAAVSGSISIRSDGTVIVPCADSRVYAFTPWGEMAWIFLAAGVPTSVAIGVDSTLYFGTDSGTLVAVSGDGEMYWNVPLGGRVGAPVLDASGVYVSSLGRGVAAFDLDGSLLWSLTPRDPPISPLSLGSSKAYYSSAGGQFCSVPKSGGEVRSVRGATNGAVPLLTGIGTAIVGGKDWVVYAYDAETPDTSGWPQFGGGPTADSNVAGEPLRTRIRREHLDTFDYKYSMGLAFSTDLSARRRFLSDVRASLEDPARKSFKLFSPLLLEESASSDLRTVARGVAGQKSYPSYRAEAYLLLGVCGDLHTRRVLLDLLQIEWDATAFRAGIEALGMLGNDTDGKVVELFEMRYREDGIGTPETLSAMVTALDRIGRYTGFTGTNRKLLVSIFSSDNPRGVREKALETLRGIVVGAPATMEEPGEVF